MSDDFIWGLAARDAADTILTPEGQNARIRVDNHGELITESLFGSKKTPLANEGSYWVARNLTPGTAVLDKAASIAYDATYAFMHIKNTSATKRLYLDYIKLQAVAAGTSGVTWGYAIAIDKGVSRYTSGATAGVVLNPNTAIGTSAVPEATISVGALVTAAASADNRVIAEGTLRVGVIKVAGDTALFDFGGDSRAVVLSQGGTTIANFHIPVCPVVLAPGDQLLLHEFGTSQATAASFTYEAGFFIR